MVVELLLNSENNERITVLDGRRYDIYDDGGPNGNPTTNLQKLTYVAYSQVLTFKERYQAVLFLSSHLGYEHLGIFKNKYSTMSYSFHFRTLFLSNEVEVPEEDIIYLQSGHEVKLMTFQAGTTITVAYGSSYWKGAEGFHLVLLPGDVIHNVSFQGYTLDGTDFSNSTFKNCDFTNTFWNNVRMNENTSFDVACQFTNVNAQNITGRTDKLPPSLTLKHGHLFGNGLSHKGKDFGAVDLQGLTFENNDLRGTNLSLVSLDNKSWEGIIHGEAFSYLERIDSGESTDDKAVPFTDNLFGLSVEVTSNGNVLVVGNPRSTTTERADGKAKVFERKENSWIQKGDDITISDPVFFADQFGFGVSISQDGNIVAVSGIQTIDRKGFVCVYEFVDNKWNKLGDRIEGEAIGDRFGYYVSLSRNGKRVSIGAVENDGDSGNDVGHIRVYEFIDNVWRQIGKDIDGNVRREWFGHRNELSSDGKTVVGNTMDSVSVVRVFEEVNGEWRQKGSTLEKGGTVAISGDGNLLVVDNDEDDIPPHNAVQTYVFDGVDWRQKGSTIATSNNSSISWLSLTEDGSYLLYSTNGTSKAKVYEWNGNDWQLFDTIQGQKGVYMNHISDNGEILVFGDWRNGGVDTYIKRDTQLPKGWSIFNGYLIREDIICFHGSEVVETDQGSLSIQNIDPSIHTIRQQPIHKLSRTRCKETKMVSIKKNSLGENIPNKDTLVTMNHQIFYNQKMVPARVLTRKNGVSFVESNNQIVYNVLLPTHTYMRVNNMTVETLHPIHL